MPTHTLTVEAASAGARLDLFIGERLSLSRNKLKALFESEAVRVDGRKAKKGQTVSAGQTIEVTVDERPNDAVADATLALTVLYEDESLVFVDKPAGVPSQPLKPGETGTVANALLAQYPEMAGVGADVREAGLCHRLDVETSGVLLAARTREAWEAMRAAFSRDDDVEKQYLALVSGPIGDSGDIELPLAHSGDHVRTALTGDEGRPAHSAFRVLSRSGNYSLVEVRIFTGVLHQVRAHLAAIGAPIVGDTLYGGEPAPELKRFFLHAATLTVPHPKTRQRLTVSSPLPAELAAMLASRGLSLTDAARRE